MVGLSVAWHLQERGVDVTVLERGQVAAGASWGNAGWLSPALAAPLPEPSVVRFGVRGALSPSSPVYVPLRPDAALLGFLTRFLRSSTTARWEAAMRAMAPLNALSLEAFDQLVDGGVASSTASPKAHLACFQTPADRAAMVHELDHVRSCGQPVDVDLIDGDEARSMNPALSGEVTSGVALRGQRYLDPGEFVAALAEAVVSRGGTLRTETEVRAVRDSGGRAELLVSEDALTVLVRSDAVVIATGAWLGGLVRRLGVRVPVVSGRGYSFSVPASAPVPTPIYFPVQRVACTPLGDRLRVAGMMELRRPDQPLDPRRVAVVAASVQPLLSGIDLDDRHDEWVGARPFTSDGLPLIGPSSSPRIWVAGGHGMWGVTQGPATGRLVAEGMTSGVTPGMLRPFDPLR
jgi:D-amino-acid dehydrogenase